MLFRIFQVLQQVGYPQPKVGLDLRLVPTWHVDKASCELGVVGLDHGLGLVIDGHVELKLYP